MNFEFFLQRFNEQRVKYILIGGAAAIGQGSAELTRDLDICYARDDDNLRRLATALQALHPALRGAPPDLPFRLDWETLKAGLNFTLATEAGDLDLLGEIAGVGTYEQARQQSEEIEIFGVTCHVLTLEGLIASKRAAGRPKDLHILPELEALLELRRKQPK